MDIKATSAFSQATVMRKVYQRSKLAAHYSLHDGDMLHLLRYVCGNIGEESHHTLKTFVQINCGKTCKGHMQAALCWLSKHNSLVEAIDSIVQGYNGPDANLREEIIGMCNAYRISSEAENCLDMYWQNTSVHIFRDMSNPLYQHLPLKFWDRYRRGLIDSSLLSVLTTHERGLYVLVENLENVSAWKCSQNIRIVSYMILSASSPNNPIHSVTEYDRGGKEFKPFDIGVPEPEPIHALMSVYELCTQKRIEMFAELLGMSWSFGESSCEKDFILTVIIAYWVINANPKVSERHLISLLGCLADMKWLQGINTAEEASGLDMECLHCFAQFQTVLCDSLDLLGLLGIDHSLSIPAIVNGSCFYKLDQILQQTTDWRSVVDGMPASSCLKFNKLHSDVEHNLTDNCFNKGVSQRRARKPTATKQETSQRDGKYCLPNPENMDRNHRSQEHTSTTNPFAVLSSLDTDDSSTT